MSRPPTPTRRLPSARRLTAPLTAGLLTVGALTALPATQAHAAGSVVKVTGSQGDWQLTVDGSPYTVKGLTWGPSPADADRYMPDLASMGVNTIRTWGTDASSRPCSTRPPPTASRSSRASGSSPAAVRAAAGASTTSPTPRTRTGCSPSSRAGCRSTRTTPAS